ncbi:MAG: hypothetical protein H6Q33_3778 [Deltaproteobacteria bacterium]|nr:hypothetical protein [Deltaproteobacteria bacterium]
MPSSAKPGHLQAGGTLCAWTMECTHGNSGQWSHFSLCLRLASTLQMPDPYAAMKRNAKQ